MGKYTAELFDAVRKGDERAVASLLAKRASVASVDEHAFRSTPLHEAARHGWLSVMRVLIDNYADVNATNVGNETPLFYAAQEGRTGCVQLLLDMGADARIRSKVRCEPRDIRKGPNATLDLRPCSQGTAPPTGPRQTRCGRRLQLHVRSPAAHAHVTSATARNAQLEQQELGDTCGASRAIVARLPRSSASS